MLCDVLCRSPFIKKGRILSGWSCLWQKALSPQSPPGIASVKRDTFSKVMLLPRLVSCVHWLICGVVQGGWDDVKALFSLSIHIQRVTLNVIHPQSRVSWVVQLKMNCCVIFPFAQSSSASFHSIDVEPKALLNKLQANFHLKVSFPGNSSYTIATYFFCILDIVHWLVAMIKRLTLIEPAYSMFLIPLLSPNCCKRVLISIKG